MTRALLLVAVLLAPTSLATEINVEFQAPTYVYGTHTGSTDGTATIIGQGTPTLLITGNQISLAVSEQAYSAGVDPIIEVGYALDEPAWVAKGTPGPGVAAGESSTSWGIRISGASMAWQGTNGKISGTADATTTPSHLDYHYFQAPYVLGAPTIAEFGVSMAFDSLTELNAAGSFEVEIFGFDLTVDRTDRDTSETGFVATQTDPRGNAHHVVRHARLLIEDGSLSLADDSFAAAILGANFDLDINGLLHIPLTTGALQGGEQLPDGTWQVNGSLELRNTQPTKANQMSAQLIAPDASIMIDGKPVNEIPQSVVVAATTTIGLVALALAILKGLPTATALLTRLPPEKALENANRKVIYSYITEHPGTTFREVLRGTDLAAGTARHHLTVLARSRMIVEHGHRSTLRYFENHGKFDATWSSVVLLREDDLAKVYNWLEANPEAIQRDLLEHAESTWSWSRSTTQHRLARLIDGGLVKFRQSGRRKIYEAVPADQAQAPMGPKTSWT